MAQYQYIYWIFVLSENDGNNDYEAFGFRATEYKVEFMSDYDNSIC